MRDTAIALLETTMIPSIDMLTSNTLHFNRLAQLSEAANQRLGYIAQKVIVNQDPDNYDNYMIEFTGNLERLMDDQAMDINEAVTAVAEANHINVADCTVVFDKSSLDKISMENILRDDSIEFSLPEYKINTYKHYSNARTVPCIKNMTR